MSEQKKGNTKKKKSSALIWNLVMLAAVLVLAVSLWQLSDILLGYYKANSSYDTITSHMAQETVPVPDVSAAQETGAADEAKDAETSPASSRPAEPEETEEAFCLTVPDFGYLQGLNGDVIAWIQIPGTRINYPIVRGSDNEFYLTHTFAGEENTSGAIFMDAAITDEFDDKNPIIYGHNLKSGYMFSRLNRYARRGFWDANRFIYITTPEGLSIYQVFSAYQAAADADIYYFGFGSDDIFQEYLDRIASYSIYDAGISVNKEDSIITLSTCANDTTQRFVVHAKRVQN